MSDLRRMALRRWPRGVADYVEGGADAEVSLRANRAAYEAARLTPSILVDVDRVDLSTQVAGLPSDLPLSLAPTGYTRMMHPGGELAVVRAAGRAGVPYALSTMATTSLEEVVAAAAAPVWFQVYVWRDRGLTTELVRRAQEAGCVSLMLTVDTAVTGLRARDLRRGFTVPPSLSPSTLLDMATHPAWWTGMLRGDAVTFANMPGHERDPAGVMELAAGQFDPTVSWRDLEWFRGLWPGHLSVKGILSADDAARAVAAGVDAVVLSNHGGRQLDRAEAPVGQLPEVRDRLGSECEILVDSGIRSGADVAVALALGASSVLVGRPYLYGLGAGGEAGVDRALTMLREELVRTLQLLGVTSVGELRERGPQLVRLA